MSQKSNQQQRKRNQSTVGGDAGISEANNLRLEELQQTAAFQNTKNARSIRNLFAGNFEWTEHLIYTVIALAMQFVLGHDYAFPDGIDPETERACANFGNHKMCGLEVSLERAQVQLRFLTPFVLGGWIVSTVGLWTARRTAYLALCGAVRNMNVNLGSLLPLPDDLPMDAKDTSSAKAQREHKARIRSLLHARKTMARWSLLGYELSVLKARGQIDVEETAIPHLKHLGLLKDGEWEAMVPGDRHTTIWLWMQTKTVKLGNQGVIDQVHHVQTICSAITLIRDRANDLMSALNRDQPFPYASITGVLVNFFLLLNALWKGVEWAIWFYEVGPQIYYTPKMYIEIAVLLITSLLFGILYDLSQVLYNPFGMRPIDLPHVAVGGGIRKMARAFASGDYLPPTMDSPENDASAEEEDKMDESEEEEDSGYFIPPPVDKLRADRRGSLFAGISKKLRNEIEM